MPSTTISPQCSMSPAGLLSAFLVLAVVVLGIGVGFTLAGAWPVLPFAGLEALALGAAFVVHARQLGRRLEQGKF